MLEGLFSSFDLSSPRSDLDSPGGFFVGTRNYLLHRVVLLMWVDGFLLSVVQSWIMN